MASEQDKIWRLIDDLVTLPTLPTILVQINELVADQNSSAADVAAVIQIDVAIATKVLRLANSAYYGLRSKVTSVQHAIAMLGFNIIKNLAITATVFENFQEGGTHPHFDHEAFWRHCVATGTLSRMLADRIGLSRKEIEGAFICGLLHDVGKIILEQHLHDRFMEVLDYTSTNQVPLVRAERELFDFTHAEVGALLADRWHLAPEIVAACQFHHTPLDAPAGEQQLPCIIHVADIMARLRPMGHGGGAVHPRLDEAAWAALGLGPRALEAVIREFDEIAESDAMMAMT